MPAAVGDVVRRRVAQLPESCQEVLRTASVGGRELDLAVLAAVLAAPDQDADEELVLAELERAQAAGLVVEDGPERFRFAHALTREALYASVPPTQRARRHARLAAVLEPGAPSERLSEVARHWLRSGPRHARQGWQAARRAAEHAERLNAHDEAAGLLADAVRAQADDPAVTDRERYDLRFARARAAARAGDDRAATEALHEALGLARRLEDVELLGRAAVAPTDGALWVPRAYGTTDHATLEALQEVLDRLGDVDSPLRCRALLARAAELQHTPNSRALREALVEQGLAVARRLGDPVLVGRAYQAAVVALWWSGNARDRFAWATEAVDAARAVGDDAWLASALVLRANAAGETGQVEAMQADAAAARGWPSGCGCRTR